MNYRVIIIAIAGVLLVACGETNNMELKVFETSASGKNSSNVRIGFRENNKIINETVNVDEKILNAGHHHGSTYYEHLSFLKAVKNNTLAEVSLEDGLRAVAIGEAAELSIKENRVVQMSEFNF